MVTKTYCDACRKEIKYCDSWHLKLTPRKIGKEPYELYELCEDCIKFILKEIKKK